MEIPASDTPECAPSGVHLSSLASHILQQTPFLPKAASSEPGCLLLHEASILEEAMCKHISHSSPHS